MCKAYALFRDVINDHHPIFKKSKSLRKIALDNPSLFNIERLVEETLAHVGGYNFVDEEGRDFDDKWNSDSKTVTVHRASSRGGFGFTISNIDTKIGSLRVVIYNPFSDKIDFMYIPKKDVEILKENDGNKGSHRKDGKKQRIRTTWNMEYNNYNKLNKFKVDTFVELATKGDK